MKSYYLIDFKSYGDSRGLLTVFQKDSNIPFELKRVFYSNQVPTDAKRACHANRNSEFVLVSVAGSCTVLADDGKNRAEFVLDSPQKGLYCGKMVWKEMYNFSPDNVLLVLTSTEYDANEYIKDYEQFKQEVA
jgi:dTDP-4-dehydrorhamnose 3,5-epimerase-like enzyme